MESRYFIVQVNFFVVCNAHISTACMYLLKDHEQAVNPQSAPVNYSVCWAVYTSMAVSKVILT